MTSHSLTSKCFPQQRSTSDVNHYQLIDHDEVKNISDFNLFCELLFFWEMVIGCEKAAAAMTDWLVNNYDAVKFAILCTWQWKKI